MLQWSSRLNTGIPLVDAQHESFFKYINKLELIIGQEEIPRDEVDNLVEFIDSYVENHFEFEEECMFHEQCPANDLNKAAHAKFTQVWAKFRHSYDKLGPDRGLLIQLHKLAHGWVRHHICKIDIQLRKTHEDRERNDQDLRNPAE